MHAEDWESNLEMALETEVENMECENCLNYGIISLGMLK